MFYSKSWPGSTISRGSRMQNYFHKIGNLITGIVVAFLFMLQTAPASAQGNSRIETLQLDGRVINFYHPVHNGFMQHSRGASSDSNRSVEAIPITMPQPRRGIGYEWVLQDAGGGFYYIINLKSGLYLTKNGNVSHVVSVWGNSPEEIEGQKWYFHPGNRQETVSNNMAAPGTYGTFKILNKLSNHYLTITDFGASPGAHGIVTYPQPSNGASGYDWVIMPALETDNERLMIGNWESQYALRSSSLASVRRVTIESIKAITVSTGQDGATEVLFTAIDLAVDVGLGVATGGTSAAATTAVRTVAKTGGRAITKSSLKAAAKAGAKAGRKSVANAVTKKALAKEFLSGAGEHYLSEVLPFNIPDPSAEAMAAAIGQEALDLMSSEAMFNKIYGESPDDLYISVNGTSIFPNGGRSDVEIKSQQTLTVNKSFVFERFDGLQIQLVEYDSASDDDDLGSTTWFPYYDGAELVYYEFEQISALNSGRGRISKQKFDDLPRISAAGKFVADGVERYEEVLISNEDEGSLYEITYRIEPFVPGHMVLGKAESAKLKKRMDAWALNAPRPPASQAVRTAMAPKLYHECGYRGGFKSESGGVPQTARRIKMYNRGSKPISIYWVNSKGQEVDNASRDKPLHVIAPGRAGVEEWGSPSSIYIAVDSAGECVGLGRPDSGYIDYEFNFNPDLVVPGKFPLRADRDAAAKAEAAARKAAIEAQTKEANDTQNAMLQRLRNDRMVFADTNLENCALRGSVQTAQASYVPTIIHNLGAGNLKVYEIDSNGGELQLATLGADTYQTINAPQGGWIVATNAQGECSGLGMPSGQDNQMIFNSDKSAPAPTPDTSNQGYIDTNEYADDQSGLEDYPEDMSQYVDQSQLPGVQAGPGCEYIGQVSSQEGGNIVTVQFSNATSGAMDVYWIDGQGEANNYEGTGAPVASVPAQSYQGVRTKIGHVFAAVDNFGNCLGVGQVEIDGEDFRFEPLQ